MSLILHVEPRFISPYVFACWVTLKEKSLPFDIRVLDSAQSQTTTTDYLASTVTGRVPSLLHDDFGIAESSAIIEYLDEAFPSVPILPREVRARARCRQVMSWLRSDETEVIRRERPTTTIFYKPATTPLSKDAAAAAEKLCEVAGRVLASGRAHVGDAWNIVDAELAFMIHRLIASGDPIPEALSTWARLQWKRPSVQSFVQHKRPPM